MDEFPGRAPPLKQGGDHEHDEYSVQGDDGGHLRDEQEGMQEGPWWVIDASPCLTNIWISFFYTGLLDMTRIDTKDTYLSGLGWLKEGPIRAQAVLKKILEAQSMWSRQHEFIYV
jgi:hypothetical protein